MQIDVVGGGSLGLLFGGRLAEAGADVTIWTRSREQAELLRLQGIRLLHLDGSEGNVPVRSCALEEASVHRSSTGSNQLTSIRSIWLTVKQTDLSDVLLDQLEALTAGRQENPAVMVCLQNGIGHLERIQNRFPDLTLLAAVTTEGARRLDARSVQHTGQGQLYLGRWHENICEHDEFLEISQKMLVSQLQLAGFTSFLSNHMDNRIFQKLLINAIINPLTALFDVVNGELPEHPSRLRLMRELYAETEIILQKAGMVLSEDGWKLVTEVCKQTSGNVSSMLSDVRLGRRTEIDAINGGIVSLAEKHQLPAPLNRAIIALIHALYSNP
ncbi:ketopantoate reductase family protein [Paenibacillus sp. sgz302251]|uniref:ketopantoate reductase family protein n=1 Tax=Paenibacillus sp. sgz302251 TaxID=3414493 RepID=UPI003C7B125F